MSSTQRELFTVHFPVVCFYNQCVTASILIYSAVLWSTLSPIFSRHYLSSVLHKILSCVRWCFLNVKSRDSSGTHLNKWKACSLIEPQSINISDHILSTALWIFLQILKSELTLVPSVETKVAWDTYFVSLSSFSLSTCGGGSCQGNQSTGPGEGRNDTAPIVHPHNPALLLTVSPAMMGGVRDKTGKRSDGVSPSQPRPCQHV